MRAGVSWQNVAMQRTLPAIAGSDVFHYLLPAIYWHLLCKRNLLRCFFTLLQQSYAGLCLPSTLLLTCTPRQRCFTLPPKRPLHVCCHLALRVHLTSWHRERDVCLLAPSPPPWRNARFCWLCNAQRAIRARQRASRRNGGGNAGGANAAFARTAGA